jgi:uncharacterized protein
MIIDAHTHLGCDRYKDATLQRLLNAMDKNRVDRAVICPVDHALVAENRAGNDLLIEAVKSHPDRLRGMAAANPWHGQKAVDEFRRAVAQGLSGLKIKSPVQGFLLSDEIAFDLYAEAERLNVPVYCHTGTYTMAMPFQLAYLARRFPRVKFIMGHSGASDFWSDVPYAIQSAPNIYLETSKTSPTTINSAVLDLVPKIGKGRILFGSDFPVQSFSLELLKLRGITQDTDLIESMLCRNAAAMFDWSL